MSVAELVRLFREEQRPAPRPTPPPPPPADPTYRAYLESPVDSRH